ncbi:hypothetical protein DPM13_09295 [Paracoccus mutanolyticus]|uniref:Uncharacterized protein n=1 Tax=Paracoccus mutanolyticus TaxID=1499308 RepID=A0ABM6WRF1_9RHOB|nr:hypothetical protein DPM13_09295 [Paracoccus mutanolyticus]
MPIRRVRGRSIVAAHEVGTVQTGLRKHAGNPKFKALGERLEDLKNRHQQGLLLSIDFLKELLALAKDVVKTEARDQILQRPRHNLDGLVKDAPIDAGKGPQCGENQHACVVAAITLPEVLGILKPMFWAHKASTRTSSRSTSCG